MPTADTGTGCGPGQRRYSSPRTNVTGQGAFSITSCAVDPKTALPAGEPGRAGDVDDGTGEFVGPVGVVGPDGEQDCIECHTLRGTRSGLKPFDGYYTRCKEG